MKLEQKQLIGFIGRCAVLIVFSSLYAIGGSGDFFGGELWIRRWLAPAFLCAWAAIVARDWRPLVLFPLMGLSLTLPYGADQLWQKIFLRGGFGLAAGLAFSSYNIWCKRFSLVVLGVIISVCGSIALGVWNQTPNPMIEQGAIGAAISFAFIFGVRKKE